MDAPIVGTVWERLDSVLRKRRRSQQYASRDRLHLPMPLPPPTPSPPSPRRVPLAAAICALLAECPGLTGREIAAEMMRRDITYARDIVAVRLYQLKRAGRVRADGAPPHLRYRLASEEGEPQWAH